MDSNFKSKSVLPSYESVCKEVEILRKEMHNQLVILIRDEVGYIQGLDEIQFFFNFRVALMNLDDSLRPSQSSWSTLLLYVFMPDVESWLAHVRIRKILQIEKYLYHMESYLFKDGYQIGSLNSDRKILKILVNVMNL